MVNQDGINKRVKNVLDVIGKDDLILSLKRIGLTKGMIIYVQADLITRSYVNGGYQCVIEALQEVVGYEGTIVSSAFANILDPACNKEYRFERDLYDEIRHNAVAFHKKRSSANSMFAEQMMKNDAVYRSNHPTHSCVAWGKYAKLICDQHPLHFPLGKESYIDKMIQMKSYVLLLGVNFRECDVFKYASSLCNKEAIKVVTTPIEKQGGKEWVNILDYEYHLPCVDVIKEMMEEREIVKEEFIGSNTCYLFSIKEACTLAQGYFYNV